MTLMTATSVERWLDSPEYANAIWALVDVNVAP
ncbi:type II toxin-antitoxin system HicB family antitoxin [Leminorella grimontii]|nr:type II toxin-antitoxin system HicB family antitoxin [Leminorella grimontii]